MAPELGVTRVAVILDTLDDWFNWIFLRRDFAKDHKIWIYVDNGLLTSLPACWDTLRAGTNEGYFDFQHIAFFAHVNSGCKSVLTMY
jgi:hypothetical protein